MLDKLDFLVRFWELKERHASSGAPLTLAEQRELLQFLQLASHEGETPKAGPVERDPTAIPAQVIGDGGMQCIELRDVSSAALLIASAAPLRVGAQVVLRAADAVSGYEYALPCRVMWAYSGAPCTMALAVDGVPRRSSFMAMPLPSSLSWSPTERYIG